MTDDEGSARKCVSDSDPLSSAQQHLSRFFDLSLDLLCVAGTDGFFKEINPAFQRVLGYSREELLSSGFMEFVHPDDRPATQEAVERLAKGLPVVDFQNRYRAADGSYRWLAWRSAPDPDGVLIYAIARDITEHKQSERIMKRQAAELSRSNADLEQFAYVASHDLRAPLRALSNLASWIEQDMPRDLPDPVQEHLRKLKDQVRRMEKLTEELLRYARAGRSHEKAETVDVGALVKEIVDLLSPPPNFEVVLVGEAPTFRTFRSALAQVFRNLISNAIHHHDRAAGRVELSARLRGRSYEFEIADDGPGVPADFVGDLFQMFTRHPGPGSPAGTGMGLALVKRIVEGQGGRVELLPSDGRGSTFRFTWPRKVTDPEGEDGQHSYR